MEPVTARKTWRTLEPLHGFIYFAPEATDAYTSLGIEGRAGYFASRAAAMGPVPAEVVIATFYNFCPELVRGAIPAAWAIASPEQVLAARLEAVDKALRRVLGDEALSSPELSEAADLARRAADAACQRPEGRPLFAAHAALPWPDETHLRLWHAQTLLREFRGDGHIAALVVEGVSGIEALILHAATGEVPDTALRASRAWPDDAWASAVDSLRARGLVTAGEPLDLTDEGREHRQRVEDATDAGALVAYEALGDDACERLRSIARPFSRAIVDSGLLFPVR